jgi:class 3 adenylate cyclase/Tfp pilus assembly protein PilF
MQVKNYLSAFLLIVSYSIFSQSGKGVVSVSDSVEVNRLIQLSRDNFGESPEKSIIYGQEAFRYADSVNYLNGAAIALKNIGIAHYYQGQNADALDYYERSLEIYKTKGDLVGEANILNNIGAIYFDEGDDANALDHYLQSLKLGEKTGDKLRILSALNNIGGVYQRKINPKEREKAQPYFEKALALSEELKDNNSIGTAAVNLGEFYFKTDKDSLAVVYFNQSVKAFNNSENSPYVYNYIGKVHQKNKKYNLAISYHNRALKISEKLNGSLDIVQSLKELGNAAIKNGSLIKALDYFKRAEGIAVSTSFSQELKEIYESMALGYNYINDYKSAFLYQTKYAAIKDTLYNNETDKKLGSLQFEFDLEKKQGEINLLTKDKELQEAALKRQRLAKNAFLIGALLILFITINLYRNYLRKVRTNRLLDQQKDEIERLLLNTLPAEIAKELQETGKAEARDYDNVSVLFSDFVDFTVISENNTAQELVAHLNKCIGAFDDIMGKYGLEKIKTIGDAYMCAGGIPNESEDHTFRMIQAGHEMIAFMQNDNIERVKSGKEPWNLRIGVHVGHLVAGVVGKKKYIYDIWGSTVNIASRMESNSHPNKVNVSQAVYDLVKDRFECTHRGKIYAKNLGEIEMYFVEPNEGAPQL